MTARPLFPHRLSDGLMTVEVWNAALRPELRSEPAFFGRFLLYLAHRLLAEPGNRRTILMLIEEAVGRVPPEHALTEVFVSLVERGILGLRHAPHDGLPPPTSSGRGSLHTGRVPTGRFARAGECRLPIRIGSKVPR